MKKLEDILRRIDGKGYKAYKDLKGKYQFSNFKLEVIKVQGDPFAAPSLLKMTFDLEEYGYPADLYKEPSRRLGLSDYLHRLCLGHLKHSGRKRGSGKSGAFSMLVPGQEVIPRTAAEIHGQQVSLRIYAGLPAQGRRVLGREAMAMLLTDLPLLMEQMHNDSPQKQKKAMLYAFNNERAEMIRQQMQERRLLTFIANGSILPRGSAVDQRPMKDAVPFQSPPSLEVSMEVDGDQIKGMGLAEGITVITGGGFHGKSTLLNAMEMGVYNHIPEDGRELCLTTRDAVKIRAEDGRYIQNADISPFINNLPLKKDTRSFFTEDASGSTSQACNIIESLELGAKALLIDEDTSASNFMIRDHMVQELISRDKEPITAYIERVRAMKDQMGISSVLVIGGLGDYFAVADYVLMMDEYQLKDISEKAREVIGRYDIAHVGKETTEGFEISPRRPDLQKMRQEFEGKVKVKTRGLDEISINRDTIDIRSLEQLTENAQPTYIGQVIRYLSKQAPKHKTLKQLLDEVEKLAAHQPLSDFLGEHGNLSYARKYETGAALTRWRKGMLI
jgi:predicted ABC-class ATPase